MWIFVLDFPDCLLSVIRPPTHRTPHRRSEPPSCNATTRIKTRCLICQPPDPRNLKKRHPAALAGLPRKKTVILKAPPEGMKASEAAVLGHPPMPNPQFAS